MTAISLSPWYAKVPKSALVKVYLVPNVAFTGLFAQASFYMASTGPGKNALLPDLNLWWTQLPISVVFTLLNVAALAEKPKKK